MTIVNKLERRSSRWRFWFGYILSLLIVSTTVYFTLGATKRTVKSGETELERLRNRDIRWEQMAQLALKLNELQDLSQKANPTTSDINKVAELRTRIDEQIKELQGTFLNSPAMEYPDKVLKGFINYAGLIETMDRQVKQLSDEIKEKEEDKCEEKVRKLEREHERKIERLENQVDALQNR